MESINSVLVERNKKNYMYFWNKSAENENKNLREEIKKEKMRYFELEKQWQNSRCSTCSKEDCAEAASILIKTSELKNGLEENGFNSVHEVCLQTFPLLLLLVNYGGMMTLM